ncbi:MAG: mechanosensitive ion channel domain-containing protein, partial [Verrucomicrobiota bacterium]
MSDLPPVEGFTNQYVIPWGIKVLSAALIFVIGRFAISMILTITRKFLAKTTFPPLVENFALAILRSVLMLVLVVAILRQFGVDTTSLVALIGAAGLAVGLALQDSLSNFASGVMIAMFQPFKEGHFVQAGGEEGTVEGLDVFSTTLRTPDNRIIIVPNGHIYSEAITNFSARETRRADMVFGIGYGDDLQKAKDILHRLLQDSRVLSEP